MKDYLSKIELKTNLYTAIQGDTLFGMICWMIFYQEGEKKLEEFLIDSEKSPQAIFSSAFPENFLPIPNLTKTDLKDEEYKFLKKLKKEKFIALEFFLKNRKNFSVKEFQNYRMNEYKVQETKLNNQKEFKPSNYIPHNSINRLTGMVEEEGGLFFSSIVAEANTKYDIYISVEEKWTEIIKKAFHTVGEFGYGKDSSIGGGAYSVINFEPTKIFENSESYSHSIALSPFVPSETDSTKIRYELFTRYGKIGHASGFETNEFGYLKKPILMMKPGAFFSEQKKPYAGKLISDIHQNKSVKHSAYTRLLGLNWNGE